MMLAMNPSRTFGSVAGMVASGLQPSGILASLADEPSQVMTEFVQSGKRRTYRAGELLLTEGQKVDHIYDVVSGTISVARNGRDGSRQVLAFMGARQFFGAASTPRYPNFITALTDVEVLAYPKADVEKALAASSQFATGFQRTLIGIIESRDDQIFTIGQRTAVGRVASFLLHLRTNQARFSATLPREKSARIALPMTRIDISDYLGVSVETVSRAFSALRKEGVISFTDSFSCEIVNLNKLRDYGGRDDFTEHRGALQDN